MSYRATPRPRPSLWHALLSASVMVITLDTATVPPRGVCFCVSGLFYLARSGFIHVVHMHDTLPEGFGCCSMTCSCYMLSVHPSTDACVASTSRCCESRCCELGCAILFKTSLSILLCTCVKKWEGLRDSPRSGATVVRWEAGVSPGGQPGGREEEVGWTGSAGLCPPTSRLLPLPRPLHCGPRSHTLSTSTPSLRSGGLLPRSCLSVSGSVFSSLSPAFLAILSVEQLHGGVDFWASPAPLSSRSSAPQPLAGQWPALLRCVLGADLPPHPSL